MPARPSLALIAGALALGALAWTACGGSTSSSLTTPFDGGAGSSSGSATSSSGATSSSSGSAGGSSGSPISSSSGAGSSSSSSSSGGTSSSSSGSSSGAGGSSSSSSGAASSSGSTGSSSGGASGSCPQTTCPASEACCANLSTKATECSASCPSSDTVACETPSDCAGFTDGGTQCCSTVVLANNPDGGTFPDGCLVESLTSYCGRCSTNLMLQCAATETLQVCAQPSDCPGGESCCSVYGYHVCINSIEASIGKLTCL